MNHFKFRFSSQQIFFHWSIRRQRLLLTLKKETCLKNNSPYIKLQLQFLFKGEEKNSYQSTNVDLLGKKHREYKDVSSKIHKMKVYGTKIQHATIINLN